MQDTSLSNRASQQNRRVSRRKVREGGGFRVPALLGPPRSRCTRSTRAHVRPSGGGAALSLRCVVGACRSLHVRPLSGPGAPLPSLPLHALMGREGGRGREGELPVRSTACTSCMYSTHSTVLCCMCLEARQRLTGAQHARARATPSQRQATAAVDSQQGPAIVGAANLT